MDEHTRTLDRTQPAFVFTAADARSGGFIPLPLALARTIGAVAQTMGSLLSAFRQDGKTTFRVQSGLAAAAGVTDRTFRRHLRLLEGAGLVATIGTVRQPNRHKLLRPEAEVTGEWVPLPRYALKLPWACRLVLSYVIYRSELSECGNACTDGLRAVSRALGIRWATTVDAVAILVAKGYIVKGDGTPTTLWLAKPPGGWYGSVRQAGTVLSDVAGTVLSDREEVVLRSGYKNHTTVVSAKLTGITAAMLQDDASMAAMYLKAVRLGIIPDTGQSRLRFWSAAVHAVRVGEDPPALFAWLVHGQHWGHVTAEDENQALDRLRGVAR